MFQLQQLLMLYTSRPLEMLGCAMLNVLYFMSSVLPVKPYAESKFFDIIVLLVVLAKHHFYYYSYI